MSEDSVSVIIASNRAGAFLREAVESVRRQTMPVGEIVLVDDGSPGSSLADLAVDLGLVLVRQRSSGVSVARNRGVDATTGTLLTFLDDDDVWHPERVAEQIASMSNNPDAAACYSGLWYLDGSGNQIGEPRDAPIGSTTQMLSGEVDLPALGTMMIRRTAFTSVGGFHPAFRQAEDTELIFRLLQVGEFVGVDRCLHGYRRHDTNATSSNLAARSGALRAIKLQQWGAEAGRNQPLAALIGQNLKRYRTAAGHSTGDDMMVALGQGDWESVWKAIGWGATHSPRATIAGALRRTAQWARNGSQRLVGQLGQSRKDSTLSDGEGQPTTQNVREL